MLGHPGESSVQRAPTEAAWQPTGTNVPFFFRPELLSLPSFFCSFFGRNDFSFSVPLFLSSFVVVLIDLDTVVVENSQQHRKARQSNCTLSTWHVLQRQREFRRHGA